MAVETGALERVRAIGRAVRTEAATLAADWRGRDAAGLAEPTACTGWAVRDVAAHLTQGAERAVVVVRHGLADTAPPDFSPETRAARVREIRTWTGPKLADSFERDLGVVFDLLGGATEPALGHVVQVPAGQHTLAQFAAQRLSEATLHGWDIRVARDPGATLRPESAALFVEYLLSRVPRMTDAEAARGLDLTVRCDLDGPGGGPVTLTLCDGSGTATRGAPTASAGTLTLPVETFIRLAWGRLDLARAVDARKARYAGEPEALAALGRVFPGH